MSDKMKYIDIRKIIDILETLPEKEIEYEIISNYSLELKFYFEDGDMEVKIEKGYQPLIDIKYKETNIPIDCLNLRIEKLSELFEIITQIANKLDFIDNDYNW